MATLPLKDIPLDVKRHILKIQGEIKIKKGISQYSQQLAIFQIIREHQQLTTKNETAA
jgi:hypothetical protein